MATALATRCPACSTVFRVVPDQLRVSEGWVRCGRCTEVFDATLSLVDMESGAARKWVEGVPRTALTPAAAIDAVAAAAAAAAHVPAAAPAPATVPVPETEPAGPGLAPLAPPEPEPAPAPVPPAAPGAAAHFATPTELGADQPFDPASDLRAEPQAEPQAELQTGLQPAAPAVPQSVAAGPAAGAEAADLPSFVRRAERAERWRGPRWRAALAALAVLGLLGLAGQIAHAYRDLVAARYPQSRPLLEQACRLLDCRVEPARAIDALAVESSGLLRVERSNVYRLSLALRNRAGIEVALPALELVLTDTQGRLIARRVLLATELGATAATLGAGADLPLQATLQAGPAAGEPVAGYTIELFYP